MEIIAVREDAIKQWGLVGKRERVNSGEEANRECAFPSTVRPLLCECKFECCFEICAFDEMCECGEAFYLSVRDCESIQNLYLRVRVHMFAMGTCYCADPEWKLQLDTVVCDCGLWNNLVCVCVGGDLCDCV